MDVHNGLEKDFSRNDIYNNSYPSKLNLDASVDSNTALHQIRTAGTISISPELFEKLYLSPQNKVKGELQKTFCAFIGCLLSLHPLSMLLMGWRGAGGNRASSVAWYYFAGGLLMVLGGLGEGVRQSRGAGSTGLDSVGFNAGIGVSSGTCRSQRINLFFFLIFFTLVPAFGLLAGSYFHVANGNPNLAKELAQAAGAFCFVTCLLGWYIFFAIMLASVDFPFDLPLVDLSSVFKGASEKRKVDHVE